MSAIYVKTGVLFRDVITVQSPAGVFNNVLADASFTKALNNGITGGSSTAGIVITKTTVDAVGKYDVLIPASAFATNGNYTLTVYVTADPTYSYVQEYIATPDGFPGSSGILSFTAAASNGRIVDSAGAPISGATVYLAYTGYSTQFTTNSLGLWGPWYSDPSVGTVTISVIKSGYAVATSSLSVGVSSITGPGADITLSAVTLTATVNAGELWAYARRMANNRPGSQADLKIKQLVDDALDKLAQDVGPNGNWYVRKGYLAVKAPYQTGTITLTKDATTCVLAGGTFPTWAGNASLYVNGQPLLSLASRTDATNLVLASAFGGTTGSYSYVLSLDNYALAANSYEFMGIMNGQSWPYMAGAVTIERLWELQNAITNLSQRGAWAYAIANNRMYLYPYPSQDAQVAYIFRAAPAALNSESDVADIDPTWVSTLRKQINCQVIDYFGDCVAGTKPECDDSYEKALSSLIGNIKTPRGLGNQRGGSNYYDYWRAVCRTP